MPEAIPSALSRPQIPALTSLRFFAAILIFMLHATNHGLLPAAWAERIDFSAAVSFFFVLSGFVLGYAYKGRSYSSRRFYQARWARVWPAAAVSILLVPLMLPSSLFLPQPDGGWSIGVVMLFTLSGIQSLVPIPDVYFGLNAVTWSISTEAGFYLLFPWLQRHVQQRPFVVILLTTVLGFSVAAVAQQLPGFGLNTLSQPVWQGLIYVNPLSRLGEFIAGMLAAEWFLSPNIQSWLEGIKQERNELRFWLATGSECLCLVSPFLVSRLLNSDSATESLTISIPLQLLLLQWIYGFFFSVAIGMISLRLGGISQLLKWSPLVFLGEISYGLYLYHQLLMIRLVHVPGLVMGPWVFHFQDPSFAMVLLISLVFAGISLIFVERPFLAVLRPLRIEK